jgi:hypothetical protein
MNNIFSDQDFLEVLARVYYSDQSPQVVTATIANHSFQLLQVDHQIVTEHKLVDFFEPSGADARPITPAAQVNWIPRIAQRSIPANSDTTDRDITCLAPYIDWSAHSTWPEWSQFFKTLAKAQAKGSGSFIDIPRQRRRLAKQLGELQFVYHDPNPALLEPFFTWKSQRYQEIGAVDLWANPIHRQFIHALHQSGILLVSVLYAAEQPIALHLGFERRGRFYWWLPTFDPQLQRFSAGRILLEDLLQYGFSQGHQEFDFLNGEETYKWCYATHSRIIEGIGQMPLRLRLKRRLRQQLEKSPKLLNYLRRAAQSIR